MLIERIKRIARTTRGRNIATYIAFLGVAAIFWLMMALDDVVQREYSLPLDINGIPDGTTLITPAPAHIDVTVRNSGRMLLRYELSKAPTLRLDFAEMNHRQDHRVAVSQQQLSSMVHTAFGADIDVVSIRPDSLSLTYTNHPGERLPIVLDVHPQSAPQYIVHGRLTASTDSVTVYSPSGLPAKVRAITSEKITLRDLTDSTTIEVPLIAPAGSLVVPSRIKVSIPVEPLIAKSCEVNIKARGVPAGASLLTFPACVKVSYLLPMSVYADDPVSPSAYVNFSDTHRGSSIPVSLTNIPDYYRSVSFAPESVEYVVEYKHE